MNTDLLAAAVIQLASIMTANWTATEAVGNSLPSVPKLAISCVFGPAFSTAAYAFGWFTALPTMAGATQVAGIRSYLSAAFAGLVASLITSGSHAAVKMVTSGNNSGH
jgi:hypothetical protein